MYAQKLSFDYAHTLHTVRIVHNAHSVHRSRVQKGQSCDCINFVRATDIMVRAEDASKISRMVDKFDLATIDTKAIRESVLSQKDIKPMSDEEHDALLSKLMDEKTNPELARMSKDGTPFEPSSKTLKKENKKKAVARKRSIATTDRPSVRKELQEIKQEKLKSAAPKMPVKNKSKKKVR